MVVLVLRWKLAGSQAYEGALAYGKAKHVIQKVGEEPQWGDTTALQIVANEARMALDSIKNKLDSLEREHLDNYLPPKPFRVGNYGPKLQEKMQGLADSNNSLALAGRACRKLMNEFVQENAPVGFS